MKPEAMVEWEGCARGCLCVALLTASPAVHCCFSRDDSILSVCIVFGYVTKPSVSPHHVVYFVTVSWAGAIRIIFCFLGIIFFLYHLLFTL